MSEKLIRAIVMFGTGFGLFVVLKKMHEKKIANSSTTKAADGSSTPAPDTKNAEMYLRKALELEPLTNSAAQQLAEIQFRQGDPESAKKTLQNALLTNPTPDTLWLGVKIARTLHDRDDEASYALQLRKQYPNSEQTKLLLSGK